MSDDTQIRPALTRVGNHRLNHAELLKILLAKDRQRRLHEIYYTKRAIHGVDLVYGGLREVAEDWATDRPLEVASMIPETLQVGNPMRITWQAAGETGQTWSAISRRRERLPARSLFQTYNRRRPAPR